MNSSASSPDREAQIADRVGAGLANLSNSIHPSLRSDSMSLTPGNIQLTPSRSIRRKIEEVEFSPEMDLRTMLSSIKADTASTKIEVQNVTATVNSYKEIIDHQALQIKNLKVENENLALSQKVILGRLIRAEAKANEQQAEINDMKSRMMRDNLIIKTKDKKYAFTKGEDTATKVKTFLKDELHVDVQNVCITRAHRMGNSTQTHNSSMIAKFPFAGDQRKIFNNVAALKDTGHTISKQYPADIEERRHFAWATYKKEKSAGKNVRFDHVGQLHIENVVQERFNPKVLSPTTAAALGAGAPEITSFRSDINYIDNHAFHTYIK